MILLDTNVISESMRIAPDRRVMSWLDRHPASSLFLCAITVDEITFGIEVLPSGRKRTRLAAVFSRIIDLFSGRIIAFDTRATTESAKFRGQRRLAFVFGLGSLDSRLRGNDCTNACSSFPRRRESSDFAVEFSRRLVIRSRMRRLAGSPMSLGDSQIAGVAKSRGYALATLNARDFRDIDLSVLEPR